MALSFASLAREHKPKLIFCGATAYPRIIDFAKFAEIAASVRAKVIAEVKAKGIDADAAVALIEETMATGGK